MAELPRNIFHVSPGYQPILRQVGLDAEAVFSHPDVRVWRSISERENATLDAVLADGRSIRLHVKRYRRTRGPITPADAEARGIRALQAEQIPTVPLVGWGRVADGRSFVITEDLTGFEAGDKWMERGFAFDRILAPTADVAAKLHRVGLHHRDLYLCHFFIGPGLARGTEQTSPFAQTPSAADPPAVRLIDAARVKRLPNWPLRRRWIVKDLAQFWYSTKAHAISDVQRAAWLARYAEQRGLKSIDSLRRSIERKAAWIAGHDEKLKKTQPTRNVSIEH